MTTSSVGCTQPPVIISAAARLAHPEGIGFVFGYDGSGVEKVYFARPLPEFHHATIMRAIAISRGDLGLVSRGC